MVGRPTEIRVRVPASSANLGPGFDTLGIALGLYDDVEVSVASDGVTVEVVGEGAGLVPCDESHLIVRAMRRAWAVFGDAPAGLRMKCRNAIPHSRGLGSSAAAAVAGVVAAAVLAGRDVELERDALLQLAAGMEGHADNAAASLLGGFVVTWETQNTSVDGEATAGNVGTQFHAIRSDAHPSIRPVVLVAHVESSTAEARGLLPARVPHGDAAFSAARCALAVLAFTKRPDLLLAATEDRLHQPYRRSAYPATMNLVDALRARGVPAAISGAGPSVLALSTDGALPDGLDLTGFTPMALPIDGAGVRVEIG